MTNEALKLIKEQNKLAKSQTKLEKAQLTRDKFDIKQKEKKSKKLDKFVKKYLEAKITSKKIMKPNKMQVHISNYKQPSILAEPNQFFQGELNKEKRSLYFS